jgi:hypothetical protein
MLFFNFIMHFLVPFLWGCSFLSKLYCFICLFFFQFCCCFFCVLSFSSSCSFILCRNRLCPFFFLTCVFYFILAHVGFRVCCSPKIIVVFPLNCSRSSSSHMM